MARQPSKYSRQRLLEQELKKGLEDLKSTRQILKSAEELALQGGRFKAPAKIPAADYGKMLRLEKKFGLYAPKGKKLTVSRKRAIRQHFVQLEHLIKNGVFAEFPKGTTPKKKKEIVRNLRGAYPRAPAAKSYFSGQEVAKKKTQYATKKGIWLPRSEKQLVEPVGTLKYDRDTGLYAVQVKRRTKSGLMAQELRYIAGSDALEIKQKKLQERFDKMAPIKKNQRLRFLIGKNESRRSFRNMKELFRYASRYRNDDAARATFLNELIIEVVEQGPPRLRSDRRGRKTKDKWSIPVRGFRASNYHELGPDVIAGIRDDMGEDDE